MSKRIAWIFLVAVAAPACADDWPMFGANPARTGFTTESLPTSLSLRWVRKSPSAPTPAWPVSTRLTFDIAFHPVILGDLLVFGNSVDNQVHALDAATGHERWRFHTGAPVRFAPALWKDQVFVASDDGNLYCLNAKDGTLRWKQRGGSDDRMLLGNDRMVSRWPARGGPVVADDVVYFAAGIWPTEGVFLYALEAATGKVLWCNKDSGSIFMGQPHGGANAVSGVAAQGYLVVHDDLLLVPTGRAVPAAFDRETGKFRYFQLQANGSKGGSATLATGKWFFNAGFTYDAATGKVLDPVGAGEVAAVPEGLLLSSAKGLVAFAWADKSRNEKTKAGLALFKYQGVEKSWTLPEIEGGTSIAVAGDTVICGGESCVTTADRKTKRLTWSAKIEGQPLSLAVAHGRLYVSTNQGSLYCFAKADDVKAVIHEPKPGLAGENIVAATLAEDIVRQGGVTEGFCADLGCGDGELALALARRTKLHIYAIDADPKNVSLARAKLEAAGFYGSRVTVHLGDPANSQYPRYFANLVVSGRSISQSPSGGVQLEVARVQRPFGGVALIGGPKGLDKTVRGPLEGAGAWTHQYADPSNTCCSTDNLVQGPLGMLWFRDSDLEGPSRHGRGPAPLFLEGRLFAEGTNGIRAVDAYNGRLLWEYSLPEILKAYDGEHLLGTATTQSNYCVTKDGVYVRSGSRCLRLDVASGKKLAEFEAPKSLDGKSFPWGYIACEGGLLFGSLANPKHVTKHAYGKADMSQLHSESTGFFAMDALTGQVKWTYQAKDSIRHNAIAIGGGKVYLIDRPVAARDILGADKDLVHPSGEMLALDADTGKILWRSNKEIFGTMLALSKSHDVLLMSYQPTSFKLPSEVGGRLAGIKASTGQPLWNQEAAYTTRPLINDRTVYAQGGAWDVVTGEAKSFPLKRSYGCGQLAGSTHLMVFRSATLGYYDLLSPKGVIDYGGIRPGCWINAIPAGGVVLVPDASSRCKCSYLNQAWIALQPLQ